MILLFFLAKINLLKMIKYIIINKFTICDHQDFTNHTIISKANTY